MDNFFRYKLLKYPERIAGDKKPITADVFLDNYCNNKCKYCTYRRWFDEMPEPYAMKFDDFKMYVSRMRDLGVVGFILTGGGEPTLNPDFCKITNWLEENGLHYGINTNFNNIVFCKPDYLKVSLDGYSEQNYEEQRGVRAYKQTLKNISEYAMWKKIHSPKTSLGVQWVACNPEDVLKFYNANKMLDVDYISIRPVESTNGSFYNDSSVDSIVSVIQELAEKDSRVVKSPKWSAVDMKFDKCYAQWGQIAVDERGNVMYCCHKPYEIVGNIMDDDILEKKEKAITNMSMCDVPCRMTFSNHVYEMAVKPVKDEMFI